MTMSDAVTMSDDELWCRGARRNAMRPAWGGGRLAGRVGNTCCAMRVALAARAAERRPRIRTIIFSIFARIFSILTFSIFARIFSIPASMERSGLFPALLQYVPRT